MVAVSLPLCLVSGLLLWAQEEDHVDLSSQLDLSQEVLNLRVHKDKPGFRAGGRASKGLAMYPVEPCFCGFFGLCPLPVRLARGCGESQATVDAVQRRFGVVRGGRRDARAYLLDLVVGPSLEKWGIGG